MVEDRDLDHVPGAELISAVRGGPLVPRRAEHDDLLEQDLQLVLGVDAPSELDSVRPDLERSPGSTHGRVDADTRETGSRHVLLEARDVLTIESDDDTSVDQGIDPVVRGGPVDQDGAARGR